MSTNFAPISTLMAQASNPSSTSTQSSSSATGDLANENVFLQLLVAQLQYQDPENPADGTQFVTQLAEFSSLQEETTSATDLGSMLQLMQSSAAAAQSSAAAQTGNTNTSNASNNSSGNSTPPTSGTQAGS